MEQAAIVNAQPDFHEKASRSTRHRVLFRNFAPIRTAGSDPRPSGRWHSQLEHHYPERRGPSSWTATTWRKPKVLPGPWLCVNRYQRSVNVSFRVRDRYPETGPGPVALSKTARSAAFECRREAR